ncbi:MAG TPA: DUF2793 domain-containing protein [Sphingomicrobium sp.]
MQTLDMLVAGAVEGPPLATPPVSPQLGSCYIVAAGATDAWTGKDQCLAAWTSGGWRFAAPIEGLSVYERISGTFAVYRGGSWEVGMVRGQSLVIDGDQVVGPRAAAIESPAGGTIIDVEGRTAIDAILGTLRQHGLIAA